MSLLLRRTLATTRTLRQSTPSGPSTAPPARKKPIGAFRGGIFGFLLGSIVTGAASYLYIYEEYKVANDLLAEDIDALRTSVQRMDVHLRLLEENTANASAAKGRK